MTASVGRTRRRTRGSPAGAPAWRALVPPLWTLLALTAYAAVGDNGVRFSPTGLTGAYSSVTARDDGTLEIWREAPPRADPASPRYGRGRRLTRQLGASIATRGPRVTVLSAAAIDDLPGLTAPPALFTRSDVARHPGFGYTLLIGVSDGYRPGDGPLLPALFTASDGEPGNWRYRGLLSGEPLDYAKLHYVWSDGGGLLRLPDGRWRVYLNGYGATLAAAETADGSPAGRWRFLRDADGAIRDLLPDRSARGLAFPTVLRTAPEDWRLWFSRGWPVDSVWHYRSPDGLRWRRQGDGPIATPADFGGRAIKNLRAYTAPGRRAVVLLLAVHDRLADGSRGWRLYRASLPLPAARADR